MFAKTLIGATAATALLAGTASAASTATAATDLHLRAGPGPDYRIETVIAAKDQVTVDGCLEQSNWCKVSYDGQQGWAYGDYLAADLSGELVPVYPNRAELQTGTVVYEKTKDDDGALALGAMGATAGALVVGGPAAAIVGGIIGSATGAAITPEETTIAYIRENPVDPVIVNGELIVGAQVPGELEVYQVPSSDFGYVNLNGRYVLIEPDSREIAYIADF